MSFKVCGLDVIVQKHQYENGRLAIRLVAADTESNRDDDCFPGEPVATATVNIPEVELEEGQTIIKTWGGNEGILDSFPAGVLTPVRQVEAGHAMATVVNVDLAKLNALAA